MTTQRVLGARGRPVQSRAYMYRVDGNLVGVDDQNSGFRCLEFDGSSRVTAVEAPAWTERYAYDSEGNQTHASWPISLPDVEAVGVREYAGTRITRAGRIRYEHDALGRVTLRQKIRISRKPETWRYFWDSEDRLVQVVTPDGTRWRYTYDPLGRRTAKLRLAPDSEVVAEEVIFTWDGTTLCEQSETSSELPNPVSVTWEYHGLRPVAQVGAHIICR